MLVTAVRLSELTGVHRDTIVKRCGSLFKDGVRSQEVESSVALKMIYGVDTDYDYDTEKARLTHHQANIASLEEEVKRKNLLPADVVQSHWEQMVANMRAKLLNLPGRLSSVVLGVETVQDAEREAMKLVRESLEEISGSGIP
jgi:hypothetical protein